MKEYWYIKRADGLVWAVGVGWRDKTRYIYEFDNRQGVYAAYADAIDDDYTARVVHVTKRAKRRNPLGYVNMYPGGTGYLYRTEEDAKEASAPNATDVAMPVYR